jgi:hypothetical protein
VLLQISIENAHVVFFFLLLTPKSFVIFFFHLLAFPRRRFLPTFRTPTGPAQTTTIFTMSTLILMGQASIAPSVYQSGWTTEHIDSVFQLLLPREKQNLKFVEISTELYGQMDEGARAAIANLFM